MKRWAVLLAWVPPLLLAWVISTTGANAHSNDYLGWMPVVEWVTSGHYEWSHYFEHTLHAGVHCFAIPILLTAAIAQYGAFNTDLTLYLALGLAVVKLLLLHDALSRRCSPGVSDALLVALSALLFSPANVNVYTFGFTATHVGLAELGFALGVWGVARFEGRWLGLLVSCAGALLATWSWGSGLAVWPIVLLAMPLLGFRKPGHFALLVACALIAALPYLFYATLSPPPGPHLPPPHGRAWLLLEAPGWLFSGSFQHGRARVAGAVALACAVAAALWLRRGGTERWRNAAPALACLAYAAALMVPVVLLRGQLNSWYTSSFGFVWVGLAGIVAQVLGPGLTLSREERLGCAAFGVSALGLFATNGGYDDKVYYLKSRGPAAASCLRHYRAAAPICEQALFQWQGGHPEEVDSMAQALERHQWGAFARHQQWTLQGDYVLDAVEIERAPGESRPVWVPSLAPGASAVIDYRRLNLFLPAPGAVRWAVSLPSGTRRAVLKTAVALSEASEPEARAGPVTLEISSLQGATAELLFTRPVTPAEHGWTDVALDLTRFAGHPITLAFRTTAAAGMHPWAMFQHPAIDLELRPEEKYRAPDAQPLVQSPEDLVFHLSDETQWQPTQLTRVEGAESRWWVRADPSLTYLPPLDLCVEDYTVLHFTAVTSPNCVFRNMQVFYRLGAEPGFSEAHSFWIPLYPGAARSYRYSLKLLGLPQGARITGLRIDPLVGPEGDAPTWADVSDVRLVRGAGGPSRCGAR